MGRAHPIRVRAAKHDRLGHGPLLGLAAWAGWAIAGMQIARAAWAAQSGDGVRMRQRLVICCPGFGSRFISFGRAGSS